MAWLSLLACQLVTLLSVCYRHRHRLLQEFLCISVLFAKSNAVLLLTGNFHINVYISHLWAVSGDWACGTCVM